MIFAAGYVAGILHLTVNGRNLVIEILAGWIEIFQGFVAGKVENASPILQTILVEGMIGGVELLVSCHLLWLCISLLHY